MTSYLLVETGDVLLLESGSRILLESVSAPIYGTGSAGLTLGATATGLLCQCGSGTAAVTLGATASGVAHHFGTGYADIALGAVTTTVAESTSPPREKFPIRFDASNMVGAMPRNQRRPQITSGGSTVRGARGNTSWRR